MEKPREQRIEVEMIPLNVNPLPEGNINDQKDGIDPHIEVAKKTESPEVSFFQKMETRMKQYFHLAKIGIFIVAGILFLLFMVWNVFAKDEKTVREETMNKLVKVMQMQGAGSFSPISEHPSNLSTIES